MRLWSMDSSGELSGYDGTVVPSNYWCVRILELKLIVSWNKRIKIIDAFPLLN